MLEAEVVGRKFQVPAEQEEQVVVVTVAFRLLLRQLLERLILEVAGVEDTQIKLLPLQAAPVSSS